MRRTGIGKQMDNAALCLEGAESAGSVSTAELDLRCICADEGISGTPLKNRTQFDETIAGCDRGEYDLTVPK